MIRQPACPFSHRPTQKLCVASNCKYPPWICHSCRGKCLQQHAHGGKPVMAFLWDDIEPLLNRVVSNNGFLCPDLYTLVGKCEQVTRRAVSILFGSIEALKRTKQNVVIKEPYKKTLDKLKSLEAGSTTITGQEISKLIEAAQTATLLQDEEEIMNIVNQKIAKISTVVSEIDMLLTTYQESEHPKNVSKSTTSLFKNEYLLAQGKWEYAIKPYNSVISSHSIADKTAFVNAYPAEYIKEDKTIEEVSNANRNNPSFYNNRGIDFRNKGEYQKAVEDYTTAISIKKDHADYYYNRAIAYKLMGYHNKSLEDFTYAIRQQSYTSEYYNGRGVLHKAMTSYERALEDYNRAIQLKQVDAYYANRAITLMSLKRPEEALTDMTKATEIAPTEPINFKNRAIIYDKLKLYAEAYKDRKKMRELEESRNSPYKSASRSVSP